MSESRDELHHLIDSLPEEQVEQVAAELRGQLAVVDPTSQWPPEFFNIIDGSGMPTDAAENVDLYLAAYGFGRDSL